MTVEKLTDPDGAVYFERGQTGSILLVDPKTGDWYDPDAKSTGSVTVVAVNRSAGTVAYAGEPAPPVVRRDVRPQNRKARRAARKAR